MSLVCVWLVFLNILMYTPTILQFCSICITGMMITLHDPADPERRPGAFEAVGIWKPSGNVLAKTSHSMTQLGRGFCAADVPGRRKTTLISEMCARNGDIPNRFSFATQLQSACLGSAYLRLAMILLIQSWQLGWCLLLCSALVKTVGKLCLEFGTLLTECISVLYGKLGC